MSRCNLRVTAVMVVLSGLTIGGCHSSAVRPSDPEQAYQLLVRTLEAWQSGRSVAELREDEPPIYFADESWKPTFQLTGFAIDHPGERYGPNVRFRVLLEGIDAKKGSVSRSVRYVVTTTPALTIARDDR